jgi:hypothetical protein
MRTLPHGNLAAGSLAFLYRITSRFKSYVRCPAGARLAGYLSTSVSRRLRSGTRFDSGVRRYEMLHTLFLRLLQLVEKKVKKCRP